MAPKKPEDGKEPEKASGTTGSKAIIGGLNAISNAGTSAFAANSKKTQSSTTPTQSSDCRKPIVDVLKEKLPDFESGKGSDLKDAFHTMKKPTGEATKKAIPPLAWKDEVIESYLKTYFTNEIANITAPGWAPQSETSFMLSNEADVVRASAVYLLNVVNNAAQAWLDKNYGQRYVLKCTTEVTSTDTDSKDAEAQVAEAQDADKTDTERYTIRTDVEWSLEIAGQLRPVAIMEYKRKHLINPTEINAARFNSANDKVDTFMEKAKMVKGVSQTFFEKNSVYLMKQAKAYQDLRGVKDVCLFDWDTMFILSFDSFDPKSELTTEKGPQSELGVWPAGILYQERGNSLKGAKTEPTFRSLLFAFLIRALKRKLSDPKDPPGAPSRDDSPPTFDDDGNASDKNLADKNLARPKVKTGTSDRVLRSSSRSATPGATQSPSDKPAGGKSLPDRSRTGGEGSRGRGSGTRGGGAAGGGGAGRGGGSVKSEEGPESSGDKDEGKK